MGDIDVIINIVQLSCVNPFQLTIDWKIVNPPVYDLYGIYVYKKSESSNDYQYIFTKNGLTVTDKSGTFTIDNLTAGTLDSYKIRAQYKYNFGASTTNSYYSDAKTIMLYGKPTTPVINTIVSNFPKQVLIDWTSTVLGSNISQIYFEYLDSGQSFSGNQTITAVNPFTVYDLSKGSYEFRIKTISTQNVQSNYSNWSSINVYNVPSKPSISSNNDITNAGQNILNIQFTCDDNGGQTINYATYIYEPSYGGAYTKTVDVTNENSFVIDFSNSLLQVNPPKIYGNTYSIRFNIKNSQGESEYSDIVTYSPSKSPEQPTQITAIPIDGNANMVGSANMDCSAMIIFNCDSNGNPLINLSANLYSGAVGSSLLASISNINVILRPDGKYQFVLNPPSPNSIKTNANFSYNFQCRNDIGTSIYSDLQQIFFKSSLIPSNSIYVSNITQNNSTVYIYFTVDNTKLVINNYDTLYYEYRFIAGSSSPDGSGQATINSDGTFIISSNTFNQKIVYFTFKLKTADVLSSPYPLTVYCIPPTTPFISIKPAFGNICITYSTNTTSPISSIKYQLRYYTNTVDSTIPVDLTENFKVEEGIIESPSTNPVCIQLQSISNVSATQSYSMIAYFTNEFGTSVVSNISYINNFSIIEYQKNDTTCRIVAIMPQNRFDLISPYDGANPYTSDQLNSRRKYEILQYFGNTPTTNFVNKLTDKQRYALASRGSYARRNEVASGAIYNDFTCNVMPEGFFDIPLYNYKVNRTYNLNVEFPSIKEWYMNYNINQEFSTGNYSEIASVYINKYVKSNTSDILVKSSLFFNLSGNVNKYGAKITYTITNFSARLVTSGVDRRGTVTTTISKTYAPIICNLSFDFIPSPGFPSNFNIQVYLGELSHTLTGVTTPVGQLYSIEYQFTITSTVDSQYSSDNIDQGITVKVISAGRSILL